MMDKASIRLQIFFEDPFWIGLMERDQNGKLSVCKITFGAEPKDYDVFKFLLDNFFKLQYSPAIDSARNMESKVNPKRLQKEIKKQIANVGIGTKSQQALQLQREQRKLERKKNSHIKRELEQDRLFILKQQKKKDKHKGR